MDFLTEQIKENTLHHAYVLVGDHECIVPALEEAFSSAHILFSGNPDVVVRQYDIFSVDHARELALLEQRQSITGGKKIFIIITNQLGEESQHALLKVFEEPRDKTHFFIVTPQDGLLPTLRSRMMVLRDYTKKKTKQKFIPLSLTEKLEVIKDITDDIKDDKAVKQDAIELLNQIENELYSAGVLKHAKELALCVEARASILTRGAMTKMILEHVALHV